MPEGPEVEIVRRGLLKFKGRRIEKIIVSDHKKYRSQRDRLMALEGMVLESIDRKGKMMIWKFGGEGGKLFAINHLGMTGTWRTLPYPSSELPKHVKLVIAYSTDALAFNDPRTFGKFEIYDNIQQVLSHKYIQSLGPDILENPFDVEEFIKRVRGRRSPRRKEIGKVLLDSSVVAGCGNIYKCEALYRAEISPFRPVCDISNEELETLAQALSRVASEALKKGGSTLQDFRDVSGYSGLMQNSFVVYGRQGEECVKCSTKIERRKQGDRGTFYCPTCQR